MPEASGGGQLQEPLLPAVATPTDEQQQQLRRQPPRHAGAPESTFWPCALNFTKVITGAGLMAIPRAFVLIGWLPGTAMLLGVAGLMAYTLNTLVQGSAVVPGARTYGRLVRLCCGPRAAAALQLAVLAFCFGFSVVYLVVIRDILLGTPPDCNGLLCEVFGPSVHALDARLVIIAVAVTVCAPLLLLRSMERLSFLNSAGVGATLLLAGSAALLAAVAGARGEAHPIPMLPQWELLGGTTAQRVEALTAVVPVILACYVAHQSLFPLMPLLQPYSQARMLQVIAVALALSAGIFLVLSVGAAAAFGPDISVNVLSNFSVQGLEPLLGWRGAVALSATLQGGYFVCILATLLLYMHPLRGCLAELLWPDAPCEFDTQDRRQQQPVAAAGSSSGAAAAAAASIQPQDKQQHAGPAAGPGGGGSSSSSTWRQLEQANYYALTYGLLAAMVLVAVSVSNIYEAVSAVGDLAGTVQAFVIPGLIALALLHRRALSPNDVQGGRRASLVLQAAAAVLVLLLGVVLFANGVAERVIALL